MFEVVLKKKDIEEVNKSIFILLYPSAEDTGSWPKRG
jgi:hypothetical protein